MLPNTVPETVAGLKVFLEVIRRQGTGNQWVP